MRNTMTSDKNMLKKANQAFREKDYDTAIELYFRLKDINHKLNNNLEFNIKLAKKRRAKESLKINKDEICSKIPGETSEQRLHQKNITTVSNNKTTKKVNLKNKDSSLNADSSLKVVVVFHLFHSDVVDFCLENIKKIPFDYDLIVTTPLNLDSPAVKKVLAKFPQSEFFQCENSGRDIGPFIKMWPKIKKYDLCCKIHTKKGVSDYIDPWRDLCLKGILNSPEEIKKIINCFKDDESIALAGPELLYGSYENLIGHNRKNIETILSKYSITKNENMSNGFFMGTMFWMRTKYFKAIDNLAHLDFKPEAGQKDGMYEHALERMLGSVTLEASQKVLLTRTNESKRFSCKIVNSDFESQVKTFHKHFDLFNESHINKSKIQGHIFTAGEIDRSISGWVALIGNELPREAIIRIDDDEEIDIICGDYRKDLANNNINKGYHAFQLYIPFRFMDGNSHDFTLIDKITGKVISSTRKIKNKVSDIDVIRSYNVWDKIREDKFNESIESRKVEKGNYLATVIMPTYNREESISSAINSVLMQNYTNIELLIVDDGSTDKTEKLIKKCYKDERIHYIKTKNQGVSCARNVGLKAAKGDFVFFLDSDNVWFNYFLEKMINYMLINRLDSAYCGLKSIDDNKEVKHYKGCDFSWRDCLYSNYIDLNTFGFVRKKGKDIYFDESLRRLVDWEYILRFTHANSTSYAPFLGVIYYDGSESRITNSVYKKEKELSGIIGSIQKSFENYSPSFKEVDYTFEALSKSILHPGDLPLVSTIITTYNHENYIAQAIESVISQEGAFNHQVIISDDGSSDKTKDIIDNYVKRYPDHVIDISPVDNVGISQNMKRCIDFSRSKYVAICEGDDYWNDNKKLAKQINFLEDNQDCSMVFSKIEILNTIKNKTEVLSRQSNIKTSKLTGQDFINEPSMNLIANFSCCLFNGNILRLMPDYMYESRTNEIAVAFYFEKHGKIGFINEVMSTYRQHADGLWTGSDRASQLKSGLKAREMAKKAAAKEYKEKIEDIIANNYRKQLSRLPQVNGSSLDVAKVKS